MLKTATNNIFNYTLWPILQLVWEPFSLKRSHFWHWQSFNGEVTNTQTVEADVKAKPRSNFLQDLIQTNFGWNKAVILKPINFEGEYRVGFRAVENSKRKTEICDLIINGKFAALVGPSDLEFFAFSYPDGHSIVLENLGIVAKRDLSKDVILI